MNGFDVRLDTTLRETLGVRAGTPQGAVLSDINADDGDRAFARGLTGVRTDITTELTAQRGDLGFYLSADGWYDPVYHQRTANDSAATFNPFSVPPDRVPAATRQLMGGDAELANAFAQDRFVLFGLPVSVRVGRQTLLWGESLFFAGNGIAAGQAPVDAVKSLGNPLATARELYLPVTQVSLRVQLRPGLALEAYDQVEWRRDRLPGVGSYFSTTDILDAGGERLLLPGGGALYRSADSTPHGFGQFGVALRAQGDSADFGFYALRYNAKLPQPLYDQSNATYHLTYSRDVRIFGASFSTYAGESNLGGEVSVRRNMPLLASGPSLPGNAAIGGGGIYAAALLTGASWPPDKLVADERNATTTPTGDTWHAQLSLVSQLSPSRWWQAASLQAEIAANDVIGVTGGHMAVLRGRTHFAAALRAVFTPQYFQVLPGLDFSLPMGIGYAPVGRSSVDAAVQEGAGDITLSAAATYRRVWQGAVSFTHFIGGVSAQDLADRDFMSVSVARTF